MHKAKETSREYRAREKKRARGEERERKKKGRQQALTLARRSVSLTTVSLVNPSR